MKGPAINGKYTIMAEINMIPFIDVALVLLIIFMVITPVLMKSELLINLPVKQKGEQSKDHDTPIEVQVNKEGAFFIGGKSVPKDAMAAELKTALGINPKGQSLLIVADRDTAFQNVVTVMDSAKTLGVTKMAVSVLEEKKKKR